MKETESDGQKDRGGREGRSEKDLQVVTKEGVKGLTVAAPALTLMSLFVCGLFKTKASCLSDFGRRLD